MEPPPASECERRYEEHKSIKACIFWSESVHEIENHHASFNYKQNKIHVIM